MTGWARTLVAVGLGLVLLAHPMLAQAVEPAVHEGHEASAHPEQGTPEAVAAARVHFTKGRALYQAGAYREAIVELDAARALDPKAKDLVFNLGVVHEKLGEIDEALRYARLYAQMDLEPGERTRAENYIKRLEGAKSEVAAREAAAAAVRPVPGAEVARVRGRFDALTIGAAGVAVVAAGVGVVMGVKALGDKPSSGFVAGVNGTAADLASQTSTAHSDAVVADVCFAGAIVAAAAAAGLYFGRYRDAPSAPKHAHLMLAPLVAPSLGGVLLGGSF
jgi:tetratricopeptide (TPR) repeat protein